MDNLRKFDTLSDYEAATLNYPAVSWVVSGDTMHYDKEAPTVNDKVMLSQVWGGDYSENFILYNCGSSTPLQSIDAISFDGVDVQPLTCSTATSVASAHIATYTLKGTVVGEEFSGDLGFGMASLASEQEMLIPSQVTAINYLPNPAVTLTKLVIEATTPPDFSNIVSTFTGHLYVPDDAVAAYLADESYQFLAWDNKIHPISEYSGNLPI